MTQPNREEVIARIIDPVGWAFAEKYSIQAVQASEWQRLQPSLTKARAILEALPFHGEPGTVPMPQSADEAAAMALLGEAWLRANAPERLRMARAALTRIEP